MTPSALWAAAWARIWAIGFDPSQAAAADAIPDQVPKAMIIETEPVEGRVLRGDFEAPDAVLLVYTDEWAGLSADLASQVLASEGRVAFVRENGSSRSRFGRFMRGLAAVEGADSIEELTNLVDTAWSRDWGPIQVRRGGQSLWLDADYDDMERENDDLIPTILGVHYRESVVELPWSLDGGAFISNGAGVCALTFEYLEYSGIVRADDDLGELLAALGCRATALIPTLVAEPTKHVDMIAQFVGPDRVLLAQIHELDGELGEDGLRLLEAEAGLIRAAAALGIDLEVVPVPTPPFGLEAGYHYSYVNGLRLGDRYLMPSYPELRGWEVAALDAVQDGLGAVPVIPVDTSALIPSGGALHCAALGLFF